MDNLPRATQFGRFLGSAKDDSGCLVPQILIDFHSFLRENEGFTTEGLFRIAGSSSLMGKILVEISDPSLYRIGGNQHLWDVHEVATLIKKWFLCMPERLFSTVTDVQLRMCAENNPERIFTYLSGSNQELLKWLINLLLEAAREETKMDPFNLGLFSSLSLLYYL